MKNIISFLFASLIVVSLVSCSASEDGPMVTPPSWKGFNYVVKRPVEGSTTGEYNQIERGDLRPGDEIKVYAVRKNKGANIGQITGKIYVRYTLIPDNGTPVINTLESPAESLANANYDGWEDPYAVFTLPSTSDTYTYCKVETACQFYFKAFGNQNSEVDYSDMTTHEEPYIGEICTDYANFHPMNGGSANSGKSGNSLKYHTIYTYSK